PRSPPGCVRPVLLAPPEAEAGAGEPHRPPGEPADAARIGQGLRARRSRSRPHRHGDRGRRPRGPVRSLRSAARAPRETARNIGRPLKYVGAAGLAGAGALAVLHTAPALGGVSPIGVRFTPALVGVGRRGHVALTFDDGPDASSTPRFLDTLA